MGTLQILPWCSIGKTYKLGDLALVRVAGRERIAGVTEENEQLIRRFLASYRTLDGDVVDPCAIAAFRSDDPVHDLSADEIQESAELIQLATFASLSARRFFRTPYSNATCFMRYVQRFSDDRGIAIHSRRRDGGTLDGRMLPKTVFGIPVQAAAVQEVVIDEVLFNALISFRGSVNPSEWTRWQNAIDCFNFANTDDSNIPLHVEWVMTAAAFQRLASAASDADAVASAFEAAIQPEKSTLVGNANFRTLSAAAAARNLRFAWAREFYELRGEYAHGRLTTNRQHAWEPFEHLLISAIAFPLLVKSLLSKASVYEFTDDDRAQVDAFESLLDSDFLKPPPNQQNSWDSVWSRLQSKQHGNRRLREIVNEAFAKARAQDAG